MLSGGSGGSPEALQRLCGALRSHPGLRCAARLSSQTGCGSGYCQLVMTTNSQAMRTGMVACAPPRGPFPQQF
eukprot:11808325-Alexandrium_andersonii.AAC.1